MSFHQIEAVSEHSLDCRTILVTEREASKRYTQNDQ